MKRQHPPKSAPLRTILPAVLFIVVGVATYWNSLGAPFVWDDDPAIVTNASIRGSLADSLVPPLETPVAGRPIVNASLALNYGLNGLDTTGYHLWNLAVHICQRPSALRHRPADAHS